MRHDPAGEKVGRDGCERHRDGVHDLRRLERPRAGRREPVRRTQEERVDEAVTGLEPAAEKWLSMQRDSLGEVGVDDLIAENPWQRIGPIKDDAEGGCDSDDRRQTNPRGDIEQLRPHPPAITRPACDAAASPAAQASKHRHPSPPLPPQPPARAKESAARRSAAALGQLSHRTAKPSAPPRTEQPHTRPASKVSAGNEQQQNRRA